VTAILTTPVNLPFERPLRDSQLADLAHELRTPLSSVIGLSAVLAKGIHGPLTDKQSEYVAQIEASGRHLLALVSSVLDLARADAGTLPAQRDAVDAAELVEQSAAMVREVALGKGVVVRAGADPGLPRIDADPLLVKQVLLNLLSNAVKFTEPGQRVGVYARREGGLVAIEVWDSGIGIAAEDLERVFEPFVQVDSSLSRRREGTGLGLPLSRRLTEAQGGRLTVRSALGYGSVFTATFPVAGSLAHLALAHTASDRRSA
jgi:signal transduction histidine kinase